MSGKALAGLTGIIVILVTGCVAVLGLAAGGVAMAACTTPTPATTANPPTTAGLPTIDGYTSDQVTNAATIITVGQRLHVPPRGWIIAVATAIQESRLHNSGDLGAANDHDSLGLFQQRPSQGWGTPEQLIDPTYAATAFYQHLLQVNGWQDLPLTQAAQQVQRSAHPQAYAQWEHDAWNLVTAVGPTVTGMVPADFTGWIAACAALGGDGQPAGSVPLPADFTLPATTPPQVVTAIAWALAQLGTPYSFGGDCTDAHSGDPARQCDCSSLTMMAYRAAGIAIPRLAADQSHAGRPVGGIADMRPGDLVFIPGSDGTPSEPGHVGLYIGQGLIVQAPHTGDYVKISRLVDWAPEIVAIRRIVTPQG